MKLKFFFILYSILLLFFFDVFKWNSLSFILFSKKFGWNLNWCLNTHTHTLNISSWNIIKMKHTFYSWIRVYLVKKRRIFIAINIINKIFMSLLSMSDSVNTYAKLYYFCFKFEETRKWKERNLFRTWFKNISFSLEEIEKKEASNLGQHVIVRS